MKHIMKIPKNNHRNNTSILTLDGVLLVTNILVLLTLLLSLSIKSICLSSENFDSLETIYMELFQFSLILFTAVISFFIAKKYHKTSTYIGRAVFMCNLLYVLILFFSFDLISVVNWGEYITQYVILIIFATTLIVVISIAVVTHILITKGNKKG